MSGTRSQDPFDVNSPWIRRSALDSEELLSRISWDELRVFLALAKLRSMNKVASQQGAGIRKVSGQLQHLQTVIGSQIFVQGRNGTRLTERGEELAEFLAKFDRDLHSLATDLSAEKLRNEGSVRLTITDGLGMVFLVPALKALSAKFPGIQVHMKTPLSFRSLEDNQTDLMIGFQPESSHAVQSRAIGYLHLLPVSSRSYLDEHGLPKRGALGQHRFVDSEQYASRSGTFRSWQDLIAQGRVAHLCDNSLSYGMLVRSGHGIGLLGNYVMMDPTFVPLHLDVHVRLPLFAIALTERLRSRPVRVVYEFLADVFGSSNPWFSDKLSLDTSNPAVRETALGSFDFSHL